MKRRWILLLPLLLLGGCNGDDESRATGAQASPRFDARQVALGQRVFAHSCARCHGANAEGAPHWRRPDVTGNYPPPPLNGSGHARHHPLSMLRHVIRNGSPGGGNMPAWGGRLSEREIDAVIVWFQSRWPDEVYSAWREIDQRAHQASQ